MLFVVVIFGLLLIGVLVIALRHTSIPSIPAPAPVGLPLTVINQSTLDQATIDAAIATVQTQVARDYIPLWGTPVPESYKVVFMDDLSVQGALGYHDIINDKPVSYIGVNASKAAGVSISSVVSHEILEMITDPITNRVIVTGSSDGTSGSLYMAEICDAVEQDSYVIGTVQVSNFVTPAWFDPQNSQGPFDYNKKLTAPLQLLPGGSYIATLSFTSAGWQQQTAKGR